MDKFSIPRLLAFAMVLIIASSILISNKVEAQVTFSKDWNPGKRVVENSDFHTAMKSASAVCHLLMNQIRQLAACETRGEDLDSVAATIFTGRR